VAIPDSSLLDGITVAQGQPLRYRAGFRRRATSFKSLRSHADIGRLHARTDGADLDEFLIELEEKEWEG
jgi:hypothetical protein